MSRKWRGKGADEGRKCKGKTAIRDICKNKNKNEEQEKIVYRDLIENVVRERLGKNDEENEDGSHGQQPRVATVGFM